jgi:predicted O-methyltransferase YrrM
MKLIEYKPLEGIRSSYKENDFGKTFEMMVIGYKPTLVVECGILDGYSLYHLANATKINSQAEYFKGHVIAFDLFDEYQYKHGNPIDIYNRMKALGVSDYTTILQGDAFKVHDRFDDESVDMLHVDISNDGNTYLEIIKRWYTKIRKGGHIIFEGGSVERDSVEWMVKYKKRRIRTVLPIIVGTKKWSVSVLNPFPSITILRKQ